MSKLPGGGRSTEYILRTFSVGLPRHFVPRNDNYYGDSSEGYFACAQYDVKKISRRRKCGRFFTRSDFAAGQTTRICRFPQAGVPRQDFRKSGNADDFFAKAKKSVRPSCPLQYKRRQVEYLPPFVVGAGNENRTRNRSLGSSYFTTKLCPHISGCISHATLLLYFTIFAVILQAFWRRF